MKIAVVSDDGVSISRHFGRAPYYVVLTVEGGEIRGKEIGESPVITHSHPTHTSPLREGGTALMRGLTQDTPRWLR